MNIQHRYISFPTDSPLVDPIAVRMREESIDAKLRFTDGNVFELKNTLFRLDLSSLFKNEHLEVPKPLRDEVGESHGARLKEDSGGGQLGPLL